MQLFLKILLGMANSVDPDQTAQEQSDLGLHCLLICHFVRNFCAGCLPWFKTLYANIQTGT